MLAAEVLRCTGNRCPVALDCLRFICTNTDNSASWADARYECNGFIDRARPIERPQGQAINDMLLRTI